MPRTTLSLSLFLYLCVSPPRCDAELFVNSCAESIAVSHAGRWHTKMKISCCGPAEYLLWWTVQHHRVPVVFNWTQPKAHFDVLRHTDGVCKTVLSPGYLHSSFVETHVHAGLPFVTGSIIRDIFEMTYPPDERLEACTAALSIDGPSRALSLGRGRRLR